MSNPGRFSFLRLIRVLVGLVIGLGGLIFMVVGAYIALSDRSAMPSPIGALGLSAFVIALGAGMGYMAYRLIRNRPEDPGVLPEGMREPPPAPSAAFGLVSLVGMLAIAGSVTWVLGSPLHDGFRSQSWPLVDARVVVSKVNIVQGTRGRTEVAELRYEYEVGAKRYRNDKIVHQAMLVRADRIAQAPVGAVVRVAYDPSDPQQSVLLPGYSKAELAVLVSTWLLACAGMLAVLRRKPPRTGAARPS